MLLIHLLNKCLNVFLQLLNVILTKVLRSLLAFGKQHFVGSLHSKYENKNAIQFLKMPSVYFVVM